ncbi:MAG TPA: TRAP transporter permease [Synergistaceae bacterium]|nr:TRAP transporter permease [Synergistaceae bacterium]HPJ25186.1 TRAP transporter permease [Synergistaceae bacterium]HPQ36742.1 TRAP transporter permease [Synergistaceae bacterium]
MNDEREQYTNTEIETGELLEELETKRHLQGWQYWLVALLAISASLFHLYTGAFGLFFAMKQRAIHWLFMGTIIFLLYPCSKKRPRNRIDFWDWILAGLLITGCVYILLNWAAITDRAGNPTRPDIILGSIMIVLVIEATRRTVGWPLPIVAIVALLYSFFGPWLPTMLAHRGFPLEDLAPYQYLTTDGIFGVPLGVSASFIFLFVLFGAFLNVSGAGQFFIDLALALTGKSRGGPAKAAVVSSALMGSVSGSSVANTVTTGSFTIPLMKSVGYPAHFAGAVEAASSTGGQIMPPVMGAAAFVMAQFLGISYWSIVTAAAVPALLYFFSIFAMVHFRAGRENIQGIPLEKLPKVKEVFRKGWHLLLPVIVLIVFLALGYSAIKAVFWSIVLLVVASWIGPREHRVTPQRLVQALIEGGIAAVEVAAACACSGIIIGVVGITGLGLAFTSFIIGMSHGILWLALILTMIASIILGMGLPTTAKYIILSTLAAPAIHKMGVPMMAAHLFILYYGVIADVTPPVALAAYAGAGIAGSNAMRTGFTALGLALAGFIVPFMFAYNQALLLQGPLLSILISTGTAILGVIALAAAVQGFFMARLNMFERFFFAGIAVMLIHPNIFTDMAGLVVLVGMGWIQKRKNLAA